MREFDHIGLTSTVKRPNEMWVESSRVWVTDPKESPDMIEYLRYEPDSTVSMKLREKPHLCFRVDNLEEEMQGGEVLLGPFEPAPGLRVVFVYKEGVCWEFMESKAGGDWHQTA
jgi:hypothetical protein